MVTYLQVRQVWLLTSRGYNGIVTYKQRLHCYGNLLTENTLVQYLGYTGIVLTSKGYTSLVTNQQS